MNKLVWGNCLYGILYLYIRGKVSEIVCVSSHSKFWPVHYLILNRKGHALSFEKALSHRFNNFAPFLYYGKFRGISKGKQDEVLRGAQRAIVYRTRNVHIIIYLLFFLYLLLFIPVYCMWLLHPAFNTAICLYDALKKRVKWKKIEKNIQKNSLSSI